MHLLFSQGAARFRRGAAYQTAGSSMYANAQVPGKARTDAVSTLCGVLTAPQVFLNRYSPCHESEADSVLLRRRKTA
jgi:hypothetical protein